MRVVNELVRINELVITTSKHHFVYNIDVFEEGVGDLARLGNEPNNAINLHKLERKTYSVKPNGTYLFNPSHLGKVVRIEYIVEEVDL